MMLNARFFLFILLVFAGGAGAQNSDQGLLLQLLHEHTRLYGGIRDAEALSSVSFQGKQIQASGEYSFSLKKKRPNFVRYRLHTETSKLEFGYNGRRAWKVRTHEGITTSEDLSGIELRNLLEEAEFDGPLVRHRDQPENEITLDGLKSIEAQSAYAIQVISPDGKVRRYYLDGESYYLLGMDRFNELGDLELQVYYRDYREVSGFPFAFEVEVVSRGKRVVLTKLHEVEVNPGLLRFVFEAPSI